MASASTGAVRAAAARIARAERVKGVIVMSCRSWAVMRRIFVGISREIGTGTHRLKPPWTAVDAGSCGAVVGARPCDPPPVRAGPGRRRCAVPGVGAGLLPCPKRDRRRLRATRYEEERRPRARVPPSGIAATGRRRSHPMNAPTARVLIGTFEGVAPEAGREPETYLVAMRAAVHRLAPACDRCIMERRAERA